MSNSKIFDKKNYAKVAINIEKYIDWTVELYSGFITSYKNFG